MFDSLIRTALTTTLHATEIVLTRSLEAVKLVNDALGKPIGHEHESHRALTRDADPVRRQPSWRPPELGDLDATAAALADRGRRSPAVSAPGSSRPPRAAVRRRPTPAVEEVTWDHIAATTPAEPASVPPKSTPPKSTQPESTPPESTPAVTSPAARRARRTAAPEAPTATAPAAAPAKRKPATRATASAKTTGTERTTQPPTAARSRKATTRTASPRPASSRTPASRTPASRRPATRTDPVTPATPVEDGE